MKALPNKIKVKFSKSDRKKAGRYSDVNNCLMATALKRMGYNHDRNINVGGSGLTSIGGVTYIPREEFWAGKILTWPFGPYKRSVVGMEVTLIKQ